ncbi:MAG: Hsp70 family protein [Planctomycetaceae bacterium]
MAQPVTIGIDLGTTKCLAALSNSDLVKGGSYADDGIVWIELASDLQADRSLGTTGFQPSAADAGFLPSVFCYHNNTRLIGRQAIRREQIEDRVTAVRNAKRFMGISSNAVLETCGQRFSPQDVLAEFLKCIRLAATEQFRKSPSLLKDMWTLDGTEVTHAVITIPAQFGFREREQTRQAAKIAGFSACEFLVEPMAAAFGLGVHLQPSGTRVMIIDVGGGTTDICLLRVGTKGSFHELGRVGDNQHGGVDWDVAIATHALEQAFDNASIDEEEYIRRVVSFDNSGSTFSSDRAGHAAEGPLLQLSELTKLMLSSKGTDQPFSLRERPNGKVRYLDARITASWFTEESAELSDWVANLANRLVRQIAEADRLAHPPRIPLSWDDVDQIHVVGGGARIAGVIDALRRHVPNLNQKLQDGAGDPQVLVAKGAAVFAELRACGSDTAAISEARVPHDIGIYSPRSKKFLCLLPANTKVLRRRSLDLTLSNPNAKNLPLVIAERRFRRGHAEGEIYPIKKQRLRIDDWTKGLSGWNAVKKWFGHLPNTVNIELSVDKELGIEFTFRYGGKVVELANLTKDDIAAATEIILDHD